METSVYLADLNKVSLTYIEHVGEKKASLGEMLQNLTQLGIVHLYDERIPAVNELLHMFITTAKKMKVKMGIC